MYPKRDLELIPFVQQFEIIDNLSISNANYLQYKYHNDKYALATYTAAAVVKQQQQHYDHWYEPSLASLPQSAPVAQPAPIPQSVLALVPQAPVSAQVAPPVSAQAATTTPQSIAPVSAPAAPMFQRPPQIYANNKIMGTGNDFFSPQLNSVYDSDLNISNHSLPSSFKPIDLSLKWEWNDRNIWKDEKNIW